MGTDKTIEQLFADMRNEMAVFYEQASDFVTRAKIKRDVESWFNESNATTVTAEEYKKCARNAISAIIMGEE